MQHLISRINIESSQAFQRLLDKTQVLTQKFGMENIIRNRLTHSYEVATAAKFIVKSISTSQFNADYQESVFNVCLLHDIGHPPFGHEGGQVLNEKFKEAGLADGFSDNNNNLVIIERNQIEISDYEMASLIKYPEKLYSCQEHYKNLLDFAIKQDVDNFKKFITITETPKRTLACEIMDEADQNTYICSDLQDCYCMELDDSTSLKTLLDSELFSSLTIIEMLKDIITAIDSKDRIAIKKGFNKIRMLINTNYELSDNLTLINPDKEIVILRDKLKDIEFNNYIKGEYSKRKNQQGCLILANFIDYVLDKNFIFSDFYQEKINNTNDKNEKLKFLRDMIADTTDNFVKKIYEDIKK